MKIAIVNAFGENRGDEAMLSSLCIALREKYQAAQIDILSKGWLDLRRFGVEVHTSTPWPNSVPVDRKLMTRLVRRLNGSWRETGTLPDNLKRLDWSRFSKLDQYDFVISSPAGPYFGDYVSGAGKSKSAFEPLAPLAYCARTGIPFGILATSGGPFLDTKSNISRIAVLSAANFWTLREKTSYEHVTALLGNERVYLSGDLVFAHPKRNVSEFVHNCDRADFDSVLDTFQKTQPIIFTLNATSYEDDQGRVIPFKRSEYIAKMTNLIDHAIEKTGKEVWLFPHFYGRPMELQVMLPVREASRHSRRVHILSPIFNSEIKMHLYTAAGFVVSNRYHPTIFAINSGCPFLCISNHFKVQSLLKMTNLNIGRAVRTPDDLNIWKEGFDQAWTSRQDLAAAILDKVPTIRAAAGRNFEILFGALDASLQERSAFK